MPANPFANSASKPGHGIIDLAILPPSTPTLRTLSFQYPLKLIAPSSINVTNKDGSKPSVVHTVFLLTYGGGLVAGDSIHLNVTLAPTTRLVLLTQGSTKIFKSPRADLITFQHTVFDVGHGAALCYLADPVQPFESSVFEQRQTYNLPEGDDTNLCICDWVSQGRLAMGEDWSLQSYTSRNEVWMKMRDGRRRLMLRDNLILSRNAIQSDPVVRRMDGLGVFGTLFIRGGQLEELGQFFMNEFKMLPQIGGRQWDPPTQLSSEEIQRASRVATEKLDGLLWTAAYIRGFVVVKFGAKEVEGAKRWLRTMLRTEGTIEHQFGEGALLCLR